jgi:hypothetical protein
MPYSTESRWQIEDMWQHMQLPCPVIRHMLQQYAALTYLSSVHNCECYTPALQQEIISHPPQARFIIKLNNRYIHQSTRQFLVLIQQHCHNHLHCHSTTSIIRLLNEMLTRQTSNQLHTGQLQL